MSNHHRKNSQSRTLNRNLDSDMRANNREEDYDHMNKSMLNNSRANDQSDFLQNNLGQFKWVQGPMSRPNATVANSDLKGIGKLAAELESQETDNLSRGIHEQG